MAAKPRAAPLTLEASLRMKRVRQENTSAELEVRRALHALGLRYRIQVPILANSSRVADVAFSGLRVALFVDGSFWHGCPHHGTWPKQNAEFWCAKIPANQRRDGDTDERLRAVGWKVVCACAHEPPQRVTAKVASIVEKRQANLRT